MIKLLFVLHLVTATTYTLAPKENGPYGNKLASGFKANPKFPQKNRVIAVSRDLLEEFPFHSLVFITGAGKLNGVWKVEDVMNERYKERIDFLINYKTRQQIHYNVKIEHYEPIRTIKTRHSRTSTIHHLQTERKHKNIKSKRRRKISRQFKDRSIQFTK